MQTTRVKDDNASVLLQNMKWPIECLFVAVRPVANVTDAAFPDNKALQTWHRFGAVDDYQRDVDGVASCKIDTTAQGEVADFLAVADVAGTAAAQLTAYDAVEKTTAAGAALFALAGAAASEAGADSASVYAAVQAADGVANNNTYFIHPTKDGECAQAEVRKHSPTVSKLSITAHGIDIYKEMPGTFFHSYTPYTFGGHNVASPEDPGAHMITFCLYPGSYQPSGHVNVSRAREFYLRYWSEGAVSSESPADLVVVASAINFLLISDGSAVKRTLNNAAVMMKIIASMICYYTIAAYHAKFQNCGKLSLSHRYRVLYESTITHHRETCGYFKVNLINRNMVKTR